jgi:glucose-1-phosphate adenylyltransferase
VAGPKVLALILAGGEGGRLELLTDVRAKPAMPFAGVYRLIDFPLSNCVHSGISDVWVLQQYEPHSLSDHLSNGRPWDLDRTHGGFRVLHPYVGDRASGWYEGNADALFRNRRTIAEFDPDVVVVLSADHVYRLDYAEVVAHHREGDAEVTIVTSRVPFEEAGRFGTVDVADDGRVAAFDYKPDEPTSDVVTTEVFVYSADALLGALDELGEDRDGSSGLTDFGEQLLPHLVERGGAIAFPLDGYWRDVGTPDSYLDAQLELLRPDPSLRLDDPDWPILTLGAQRPPARIERTAALDASWISPGCVIRGSVERAVLGPGVVVEPGAQVRDAILFHDAVVSSDARVERAIVDEGVSIGQGARLGTAGGELTLVGRGATIEAGAEIPAGGRVEPVDT